MTKEQFKKFAKEEFGYDISFEKSDEPDTYESLFGSCKGCEHAPTTYEEYCLHTCCPDAYTDKAAGCESFKKQRAIEMAIKALEQESILNKIRAEIREMSGDIETIADVLKIIDKYKAESEDKE